jgi:hypothetical protein
MLGIRTFFLLVLPSDAAGKAHFPLDLVSISMAPGDDTTRPHFTLDDEEVEEVVSTATALTRLTIMPSASDASWGVVGSAEEGRWTPASASRASWSREARGSNSVTSALTDAPSLALFSPLSGNFLGGGHGWYWWWCSWAGVDAVPGPSRNG